MNDTDTNTTNNGKPNNNNKNDGHLNMLSRCLGKEKQNRVYPVGFYPVGPFRWLNKAVRNKGNLALIAAAARCERRARPAAPSPDGAHRAAPHRVPHRVPHRCGLRSEPLGESRRLREEDSCKQRGGEPGGVVAGGGGCIPSPPIGEK